MVVSASNAAKSDAELARSVVALGEAPGAERELCARFAPRIRAYGLRHLKSSSEADDLVQRVLLLMLTKLRSGEVREPERIVSFVLGSARLTAQSMQRERSKKELLPGEDPRLDLAVEAPEPIEREKLAACLNRLGERERLVIVHSFFEGANASEIASSLGLQTGHVRVVRHRALSQLKTCLSGTEGEAP